MKNIAFTGVMATILAGTAHAAPRIVSKNYVDSQITGVESSIENIDNSVNELTIIVSGDENGGGLVADIADLQSTLNDEETGLIGAVNNVTNIVNQNVSDLSDLKAEVADNTANITKLNDDLDTAVGEAIGEALKTNEDVQKTIDNAVSDAVKELDVGKLKTQVETLTTTVSGETDGLVKLVADNKDAISVLNGDKETAGSIANTIGELAVPRPTGKCAALSSRCVIAYDAENDSIIWMDVTSPVSE